MANFKESFDKVILAEGGYVNDPDDAGGETYLGISRVNHPYLPIQPVSMGCLSETNVRSIPVMSSPLAVPLSSLP